MRRGFLKNANTPKTKNSEVPTIQDSLAGLKIAGGIEIHGQPLDLGDRIRSDQAPIVCTLPPNAKPDEPVSVCLIWPETTELLQNTQGFPQPLRPQPNEATYRVGESPGKGMGLFAARDLKQGDFILSERALLLTTLSLPLPHSRFAEGASQSDGRVVVPATFNSLDDFERHMKTLVDQMRPVNREAFMSLTVARPHTTDGSGPIHGRIRTNGCSISNLRPGPPGQWKGSDGQYGAILEKISRLNHSCSPNTQSHFDKASLSHSLFAVRDIAVGEELTNNYTPLLDSALQREWSLKSYGIVCRCEACLDPRTSDPRRRRLNNLAPNPAQWILDPRLPDDLIVKQCLEQILLIEKEKLHASRTLYMALSILLIAHVCLGDAKQASFCAARLQRVTWVPYVEKVKLGELLDPASPAYAKRRLWRTRIDRAKAARLFDSHECVVRAFSEFIDPLAFPLVEA
ncbi:hypothetical protein FB45DRAFT_848849 [Roridomyces roridus]|uniref:SET domain-containing protein n=1 Tax=Roridomyces roridus TaxID=1738132 RepID=A0AAD7AZG6_9AGAR|nr:hypothetical protein FB45DRAFT_848849 [Roridomyces roridus]